MENKVATLKDIRSRIYDLDPRKEGFDKEFKQISQQALDCMEGINDMQERKWIEKGLKILNSGQDSIDEEEKDKALSYLKEAVHTVILREDNYRE